MFTLAEILAALAQAEGLITDAVAAYNQLKATLSSQDQATVSKAVEDTGAALDTATAALDADAK